MEKQSKFLSRLSSVKISILLYTILDYVILFDIILINA